MSLLGRFRAWISGLFGGDSAASNGDAAPAAETRPGDTDATDSADLTYRCSVCNTPVADLDAECSLCGASDPVPADEPTLDRETDAGLDPDATRRDSGTAPDDEVARLRAIRAEAILGEHPSRWERINGGQFRVHVADGDPVVDTASEAADLLRDDEE